MGAGGLWDGAESATAGAQVAQHHESRGLVAPALADVGHCALSQTVCKRGPSQAFQVVVILAYGGASLEPLGFGSGSFSRWRDLDQFHHAFIVPQVSPLRNAASWLRWRG